MPTFDRPAAPALAATTTVAEVEAAAMAYVDALAEANRAARHVVDLEARRPEARRADTDALAAALANGAKDPGPTATADLEAAVVEAVRVRDARAALVGRAALALDDTVAEHRAALLDDADRLAHDARTTIAGSLAMLRAAMADLAAAQWLHRAADRWPDTRRAPATAPGQVRIADREVTLTEALAAIERLAEPAPTPQPAEVAAV